MSRVTITHGSTTAPCPAHIMTMQDRPTDPPFEERRIILPQPIRTAAIAAWPGITRSSSWLLGLIRVCAAVERNRPTIVRMMLLPSTASE